MNINLLIIFVFILAFFLFSSAYKKAHFYIYDLLWRAIIIGLVFLLSSDKINISISQWYILCGVFGTGLFLSIISSRELSFYQKTTSIILAPVTEEFLFRGLLLWAVVGTDFERVLLTSIVFALWHLKNFRIITFPALLYQIGYAFIIGFPLGYLAVYTNSLFLPVLFHAINNTVAVLFGRSFLRRKN